MVVQRAGELKRCSGYRYLNVPSHYTDVSNFGRDRTTADGLQNKCRDCKSIYNKTIYGKYTDRFIRYKHKKRGLPYDRTVTRELVYTYALGICHICGKHVPCENKWTMEHRDGEKGWTWDNIRPAHCGCNSRKGSCKMHELEERGVIQEMRDPGYTRSVQLALTS